jgi:transcriptional regulator with XRE-family HTH domain
MSAPRPDQVRERHWVCAQRLRERRLALGLTQREVVARLQLRGNPTTNRTLSAMENGRGLDLGLLPDLAVSLGCTTTYLLGLTCEPSAWQPDGLTEPVAVGPAAAADPVGILGPSLPDGFAAPGRARRRAESTESREERLA